jgi:archaellum component FlaC
MGVQNMQVEERVAKIEGIVEQMNERLNHIESDLGTLREEMKAETRDIREKLEFNTRDLRSEIRSSFKWTMGLMLTMWITIILTILFRA